MRAALHQRTACFETPAFGGLLSMRNAEYANNTLPHAEEARSAVSKHAVSLCNVGLSMALALIPAGAGAAEPGPDLARYDCTRADDGKTVPASELIDAGFQVATVGRFGAPNVMLADPKTGARANCLIRPEQPK